MKFIDLEHLLDAVSLVGRNPLRALPLARSLKAFRKGKRYKVDLMPYLKKFLRKKFQNNEDKLGVELSSYGIHLDYGRRSKRFPRYYDAHYNFVLTHAGEAIASIGFDISDRGVITVKQIQGVKGRKWELTPFRWEKLLLMLTVDYASKHGLRQVRVLPAEFNDWNKTIEGGKAKLFYDVTPKRCGFKRRDVNYVGGQPSYYWCLELQQN